MLGRQLVLKRGSREEAEKPFWISFADLMTALMVLFLVSLTLALQGALAAQKAAEISQIKAEHESEVARLAKGAAEKARAEAEQAKAALEKERKERKIEISRCCGVIHR